MTPVSKPVLVIGSTGLLGQSIMVESLARGFNTVGIARRGADLSVNITDEQSLKEAIAGIRPCLVVNTAAITSLDDCEKDPSLAYLINARAVSIMVEACRKLDARLIHISTDHYFSGSKDQRHTETDEVRLLNEYARTKYAGEAFALTDATALVVRTNITGWRGWEGRPTFFEWLVRSIEQGNQLTLFHDFYTSTMDAPTCARRVFDLYARQAAGVFNVASCDTISKEAFAHLTAELLGTPLINPVCASIKSLGTLRAESLGLDVSRAQALLHCTLPGARSVVETLLKARPSQ